MKRFLYICMAALLSLSLFGCSSKSATEGTASAATAAPGETAGEFTALGDTLTGKITALAGSTLTLSLGTLSGGEGAMPEAPSNSGSDQSAAMPGGTPPDGMGGGSANSGTPPEMPSGSGSAEMPEGTPPDGMGGGMGSSFSESGESAAVTLTADVALTDSRGNALSLSDLAEGDVLVITLNSDSEGVSAIVYTDEDLTGNMGGGEMGGNMGGGSADSSDIGDAAVTYTDSQSVADETFTSVSADENAVRGESGANVTFTGVTVNKTGDSSNSDSSAFYGRNAAVLAQTGAVLTLTDSFINTDGSGANGAFACGGTLVLSNVTIATEQDNSGGVDVTGGGSITGADLTVTTQGNSSAAIRSDRGGGTCTITGGVFTTNGTGSPAVYSTAAIYATDAILTATASEGVVIEGKNSVTLTDCTVTSAMQGTYNDDTENIHAVMLYQSMSGDADVGESVFTMTGGSITGKTGDLFYVTNTQCSINLTNVTLTGATGTLLRVEGNSSSRGWGTEGSNGGTCAFTAENQLLEGNILVDTISSLTMLFKSGTVFTGAVNPEGQAGTAEMTLETGAVWNLTADSYLTSFTGDVSSIVSNGFTVYVNGVAIN